MIFLVDFLHTPELGALFLRSPADRKVADGKINLGTIPDNSQVHISTMDRLARFSRRQNLNC